MQASSFDEEIKFLRDHRQNKTVPPTYVSQFGLVLENGVVKCHGRMNNREVKHDVYGKRQTANSRQLRVIKA